MTSSFRNEVLSEEDRTEVASKTMIRKWYAQTSQGPVKRVDSGDASDTSGDASDTSGEPSRGD